MLKKKVQVDPDAGTNRLRPMAITVKAVLFNDNGQVLMLHRAKGNLNEGRWDIPGGLLESGETVEESLVREIKEETGLDATIGALICLSEFQKGTKQFVHEKRSLRYIAFAKGHEVKISKREHDEYRWVGIEEAIAMLDPKDGYENDKIRTFQAAKDYVRMKDAMVGWQRCMADFENYKKRMQKSNEEFRKYCMEAALLELLPVVDNFAMAAEHIPAEQKDGGWVQGIMYIKTQLEQYLAQYGMEEIPVKPGDEINAHIHEVISAAEKKDEKDLHKVKKIIKKGYKLGERVIRAAMVEAGD
jgi:molecular chaperone GrpE